MAYKNAADQFEKRRENFKTIWVKHKFIRGSVIDLNCLAFPLVVVKYSKTGLKRPLSKRPTIGFQDQLMLNEGQKYCRMPPLEHSVILSTFIKLPIVIKIFVLYIFE